MLQLCLLDLEVRESGVWASSAQLVSLPSILYRLLLLLLLFFYDYFILSVSCFGNSNPLENLQISDGV
jgi:hypothetical protein